MGIVVGGGSLFSLRAMSTETRMSPETLDRGARHVEDPVYAGDERHPFQRQSHGSEVRVSGISPVPGVPAVPMLASLTMLMVR